MLVLLDIDGVMISGASWKSNEILSDGFPKFSHKAVSGLQRIISETKATIVLTTSHKSRFSISKWESIFKSRGIKAKVKKLEANAGNLDRKEEILNWLSNHQSEDLQFVIIDDDKGLNALPKPIKDKLVLTSPLIGLTEQTALDAIEILKTQELVEA